jgi:hypothetical protein
MVNFCELHTSVSMWGKDQGVKFELFTYSPYMRLFPAFSSLVYFERKIKQYLRGNRTQGCALSWPIANFCELHASVRMWGEDQGVKFELFTRSPYMRLIPTFSSLVHFEKNINWYFRSKDNQRNALPWPMVNFCELHASVRMWGEDQGVKFELFTRSPIMRLFPAFSSLVHLKRKINRYLRGKITQGYALPWPIANFCELHASVRMWGEDQGVKFELFMRSPYMRLFSAFSFLVHLKRKINRYFRGKVTQSNALPWFIVNFCELHASIRMCW